MEQHPSAQELGTPDTRPTREKLSKGGGGDQSQEGNVKDATSCKQQRRLW